jgi:hypothetical protein
MSILVGCIVATITLAVLARSRCKSRSKVLESVGRITITLALIALAPATTNGAALLYCVNIPLNEIALKVLDGGSSVSVGPTGTVSVSILASDPFFVCWSPTGRHLAAASFAAAAMTVAVIVGPLVLYLRVRYDSWLRVRLAENPRTCSSRALLCCQRDHIDLDDEELIAESEDPSVLLAPIVTDFRASAWYTKFLDIALTVLLSCVNALLQRPTTLTQIVTKAGIIAFATLAMALNVVIMRPYRADRAWMSQVRTMLLVIAACCACMNAVASAIDIGRLTPGPRLSLGLLVASVLLVAFLCLALTLLVFGVGRAMVQHASAEKAAAIESRRRWRAYSSSRNLIGESDASSQVAGVVVPKPFSPDPIASPRSRSRPSIVRVGNMSRSGMDAAPLKMQDNPLIHRGPRSRSRSRRVVAGAEVRSILPSVPSPVAASGTVGRGVERVPFRRLPPSTPVLSSNAPEVARQLMSGADSAVFVLDNPLFPSHMGRTVIGSANKTNKSRKHGPGVLQRRQNSKHAETGSELALALTSEYAVVAPSDAPAPLLPVSCPGCGIGSCSVCNSSGALRFKAAVKVLREALEKQRPKTALARCKILCEVLRDDTVLPRTALSSAVAPVSQFLWVFPNEVGVVSASCQALQLVIDRIYMSESGNRLERKSFSGRSGRGSACMPAGILSEAPQAGDDAVCESRINPIRSSAFAGWLIGAGAEGGSQPLVDLQSNADALILCNLLQHLRTAYSSGYSVAQYAATALTACCAAISELTRRDRALADREASLRSFASTSIAEVLVATLRMCEESEVLRRASTSSAATSIGDFSLPSTSRDSRGQVAAALEHVLEAIVNVTYSDEVARRFITVGGEILAVSLLVDEVAPWGGPESHVDTRPLRISVAYNVLCILCNLALHFAPALAKAGVLGVVVRVLELITLQDSCALAVSEPLLWTLKRLAQNPACSAGLVGCGAVRWLESALSVVLQVGTHSAIALGSSSVDAVQHAKEALSLLRGEALVVRPLRRSQNELGANPQISFVPLAPLTAVTPVPTCSD